MNRLPSNDRLRPDEHGYENLVPLPPRLTKLYGRRLAWLLLQAEAINARRESYPEVQEEWSASRPDLIRVPDAVRWRYSLKPKE